MFCPNRKVVVGLETALIARWGQLSVQERLVYTESFFLDTVEMLFFRQHCDLF